MNGIDGSIAEGLFSPCCLLISLKEKVDMVVKEMKKEKPSLQVFEMRYQCRDVIN